MSGAHERHLVSALACANESRYTAIKKSKKKRKRLDHNPMELLTMATHALPSAALSSHIDDDEPVATPATSTEPSLMRRMYDAFTASQMHRAQREVDRILGAGAFRRALRGELPLER